jgi:hypothetical protein
LIGLRRFRLCNYRKNLRGCRKSQREAGAGYFHPAFSSNKRLSDAGTVGSKFHVKIY